MDMGLEVVWEEIGEDLEVEVDFDHNNYLILDCSHQCSNPLVVDCCNHVVIIVIIIVITVSVIL